MSAPSLAGAARRSTSMAGTRLGQRRWWPWLRRALWLLFFGALASLLVQQARGIDWSEVAQALRGLPAGALLAAAALAGASHLLYACFDLLGRHVTGHRLATPTVMAVTFVSYAFNLNMGALLGGVASRYRLYSRLGLPLAQITRVMVTSMLTNWLGYVLLAGAVFALAPPALPPAWGLAPGLLRGVGALMVVLASAYVAACALSRRRSLQLRGHTLVLPSGRMAWLQLAMSCLNWALIAGAIHMLLQRQVEYPTVLAVLLLAAVAGVITHVPAGLGVLEAVFVALLGTQLAPPVLIAALLAYRAVYYLAPLALAVAVFGILEIHGRRIHKSKA